MCQQANAKLHDWTPSVGHDLVDELGGRFGERWHFASADRHGSYDTGGVRSRLGSGCSAHVYVIKDTATGEQAAMDTATPPLTPTGTHTHPQRPLEAP